MHAGDKSWLALKYGKLGENWKRLGQRFSECFRVLKPNGMLIFKWNETQIKVSEVLALTDQNRGSGTQVVNVQIRIGSVL